jgi:Ca2+-binding RTX toxin-like protein
MAVSVRGQIGLDVPVVSGALIQGTFLGDTLDDLSHMGDGGTYDPGTDDTIYGYGGPDIITVHNGNDTVYGGTEQDFIIDRGTGNDKLYGEGGSDQFVVGAGNDLIDGGDGIDSVSYAESQQLVALDLATGFAISEGIDTLVSIEGVIGSSGNDRIFGDAIGNSIGGQDGDDRIEGRGGNDTIGGEAGNDTLLGQEGDDTLLGEAGNDTLLGEEGGDILFGGEGNDTLDGGALQDNLHGGPGYDTLIGGGGPDTFFVDTWADVEVGDTIKDFEQGADRIDLHKLDASSNYEGDQAFNFDPTPDGWFEELQDALNDSGAITRPGPTIHGEPGEVEYKHVDGDTYVFLSTADAVTEWSIKLEGTYDLTASDFIL